MAPRPVLTRVEMDRGGQPSRHDRELDNREASIRRIPRTEETRPDDSQLPVAVSRARTTGFQR
jgi:hypothetical protein